jgi:hypothetical protein
VDDDAGKALVCAGSFRDLLDHGQSCAGCGDITFEPAFGELQQERLSGAFEQFCQPKARQSQQVHPAELSGVGSPAVCHSQVGLLHLRRWLGYFWSTPVKHKCLPDVSLAETILLYFVLPLGEFC